MINRSWSPTAAARLVGQLEASPRAVASALLWRGLRRPLLQIRQRGIRTSLASAPRLSMRTELGWIRALLDTAMPPPPAVAALMMKSGCSVFGRYWSEPAGTLTAIDSRFGLEAWRCQHLQALAALHWQSRFDAALTERLTQELPEPLEDFLRREICKALDTSGASTDSKGTLRPYPMDAGLRMLSLLIAWFALDGTGPVVGPASAPARPAASGRAAPFSLPRLALEVQRTIDTCFADPEYCGNLSNNHHLTAVVCLLLLLASTEPVGPANCASASRHRDMGAVASRWLLRALAAQFDADGAHFEYSSGYHMCSLELLDLAALAVLELDPESAAPSAAENSDATRADTAAARWSRLRETCPPLATTLRGALGFAEALLRPDGTYPLIGDFDASRIVRTHAQYFAPPACSVPMRGTELRVETFDSGNPQDPAGGQIRATVTECINGDAACSMTRALFAVPDPMPAHLQRPATRRGRDVGVFKRGPARTLQPRRQQAVRLQAAVSIAGGPMELALVRETLGERAGQLRWCVSYRIPLPHLDNFLNIRLFRQAGLLVAQGASFMVTLRSGIPGQVGLGTHSHLDHLASDVWVANGVRIADPGSWCYGESVELRNRYRGNGAHFSPLWQADWSRSLRHPFFIDHPPPPACLSLGATALRGVLEIDGGWVARFISLRGNTLLVVDASSVLPLAPYPLHSPLPLADGYFGPMTRRRGIQEPMTCAA